MKRVLVLTAVVALVGVTIAAGTALRGDGDGDTAREPPVTAPVTGAATPHVSVTLGF